MVAAARVTHTLSESLVRKFSPRAIAHPGSRSHRPRSSSASPARGARRTLPIEFVNALAAATSDRGTHLLKLSNQCFERAIAGSAGGVEPQVQLFEAAYLALASAESEPQGFHGPLPTELLIARAAANLEMHLEDVVLSQQLASVYAFSGWDEFSTRTLGDWCMRVRGAVANAESESCGDGRLELRRDDE